MKLLALLFTMFVAFVSVHAAELHEQHISYQYDAMNRLTNTVYSNGLHIGVQYDAVGNRTNYWESTGKRISYRYDAAGRLTNLLTFGPPKIDNIQDRLVEHTRRILVPFVVHHDVLPIEQIKVTAFSSNESVISTNDFSIITSMNTNHVLAINLHKKTDGESAISLIATDGYVSSTNTFTVTIGK